MNNASNMCKTDSVHALRTILNINSWKFSRQSMFLVRCSSMAKTPDDHLADLPPCDPPDGQETVRSKNTPSDFQSEGDDPVYINLPHNRLPIESDDESS